MSTVFCTISTISTHSLFSSTMQGHVAQSVGHLTPKSGVLGSIPGLATYFSFSFRFFKKGSCQYWQKYVHEVLVNCLGGLSLPRKSVVRLTDHPDMTLDVYLGRKTTTQHNLSFATQAIARPGDSREFDFYLCRALVDSLHCGDNFKCLTKSILQGSTHQGLRSKKEVQVIVTANQKRHCRDNIC